MRIGARGPLLIVGWQPQIRPHVIDAMDHWEAEFAVAVESEIHDPPSAVCRQCVIPGLHSQPARHVEALTTFARENSVSGILTFEDELTLLTSTVAGRLGLAGPAVGAVETAMSKSACRAALATAGVPSTRFWVLRPDDPPSTLGDVRLPVVVKPDSLDGSRGVFLVRERPLFAQALKESKRLAGAGPLSGAPVIIESYIEGRNVTAELAVTDHREEVLAVVDTDYDLQRVGPLAKIRLKGLNYPSTLDDGLQREASQVALDAAKACGLHNTIIHVEMRCSASGVRVIEVNPRAAGAFLPEVVQLCSGIPYVTTAFAIATRREFPTRVPTEPLAAAVRFIPLPVDLPRSGPIEVLGIECNWNEIPPANVHRVSVRVQPGGNFSTQMSSLGYVITTARNPEEACAIADHMVDTFHLSFRV